MSFKQGIVSSIPIAFSFFFVFSSLGSIYHEAGIGFIESILSTVFIFAAPLQIVLVDFINQNHLVSVITLTLIINFRFFLMAIAANKHFVGISKVKLFISLIMFSASSFVVCNSHFNDNPQMSNQQKFEYFLGVALPSFLVAILSTFIGYQFLSGIDYESLKYLIIMILPIHFSALSAKSSKKPLAIQATIFGAIFAPILNEIDIVFFSIAVPIVAGILFALMVSRKKLNN